jgi:hypothetical protein
MNLAFRPFFANSYFKDFFQYLEWEEEVEKMEAKMWGGDSSWWKTGTCFGLPRNPGSEWKVDKFHSFPESSGLAQVDR